MNDMPANVCDLFFLIDGNVLTNHLSRSLSFLLFKSLKYFKTEIIMQNFFCIQHHASADLQMYRLIFKPLHLHLTMIDLVRLHLVIHVFAPIVFEHRGKIEGFFCSLKKYGCGNAIILLCSRVHH